MLPIMYSASGGSEDAHATSPVAIRGTSNAGTRALVQSRSVNINSRTAHYQLTNPLATFNSESASPMLQLVFPVCF